MTLNHEPSAHARDCEEARRPAPTGVRAPAATEAQTCEAAGDALEALRRAELRYHSIFDNSLHGIYQSTPEGRFLNVNAAFALMLGYDSPEELIADYVSIESDYYADASARARLRRTLEEGGAVRGFECQVRRRDGALIWTRENFYAVRDAEGRLLYYEGSVEDVTERKESELALRASEARYRRLFSDANDAVYTTDLHGNYTSMNEAGVRMTGYRLDEILRMNFRQLAAPDHVERSRGMLRRKLQGGETTTCYETEIVTRSGARVSLEVSTQLIYGADGEPCGVQGIARDVTERKCSEEALRQSEERYRELFENANDIVYTHDLYGNFTSLNKTGERVTGYTRAEACRMNIAEVVAPEHFGRARQMLAGKRDRRSPRFELEIIAKDGRRVPLEISTRVFYRDGERAGVQGIARDITERRQAESALRHIAFHDALTGLPNRSLFTQQLRVAVDGAKRDGRGLFAVLFIDLDRFKVINDSLGHPLGDELLVALARRIEGGLRGGDTVARLGGDEFAILLNDLEKPEDALRVAERVLSEIAQPFHLRGHEVFTTASIGIALSTSGYTNEEEVLRDADTVMYRAKAGGAARYEVFDQRMHARVVAQLKLENDLRRAVERKEFRLHYQPIVSMETGRVAGFEALVRWQHPERGIVSPGEFIPVAEETGLIVPLGAWVLESACRQMRAWHDLSPQHADLKLSVNLSGRQFAQPALLDHITRVLAETRLDPRCLQLEITESVVMDNAKAIIALMGKLRALGLELAIDDFGTGYSSLSYLQRFPIHTLKIDRSFISERGEDDADNAEIVRTIILLARNMGKEVVAEGVETEEQFARLRALECAYAQGYLFSRPQDAAATERLLREGRHSGLFLAPASDLQVA